MKQAKRLAAVLLALLCMAAFAACGNPETGGPGGDPSPSPPPVVEGKAPQIVGDAAANFFPESPKDIEFNVSMNGGTFTSLTRGGGGGALVRNTDFAFNVGTEILTFKKAYLAELEAKEHTFTFTTSGGSCDVKITVNAEQTEGYNLQFAQTTNSAVADHFFAKASRTETEVRFDFITFGDFTSEGSYLKFVNVLLDLPELNNAAVNWKFNAEDVNVRVYSDGTVIYRDDFTGEENMGAGKGPGQDNIWWKINRQTPNYKTLDNVTVTREKGVTKFSLSLTYEMLGITANDAFRFNLSECSDNSPVDFALYDNGIMSVDGVALENPVLCSHWATLNADGSVSRPGEPEVPADDVLRFAVTGDKAEADAFEATIEAADGAVTFNFKTEKNFDKDADGASLEFVNIYLDMPENNTGANNWRFNAEDVNIRVYSDGTVYFRTDFNGTNDNLWYKTDRENGTKLDDVAITRENGVTTFSLTVTLAQLGAPDAASFRFYLKECSDQSANDFALYAGNMSYNGTMLGDPVHCDNWATFTIATNEITVPQA